MQAIWQGADHKFMVQKGVAQRTRPPEYAYDHDNSPAFLLAKEKLLKM